MMHSPARTPPAHAGLAGAAQAAARLACAVALACGAGSPWAQPAAYVPIPAGSLQSVLSAGSGNADAPVKVAAFAMRATPVTVTEFLAFSQSRPQWQRGRVPVVFADAGYLRQFAGKPVTAAIAAVSAAASTAQVHGQQPITSVSWFAAQAYCESEGARLPSWYEWEYVAAADATHADARKDPAWRAAILNWYAKPSGAPLAAVGGAPNFYGVRDMHGLVWEWVDDFNALLVSADSRNQGDPDQLQYCGAGAISLQDRENFAVLMRVALLSSLGGDSTTANLGFRCVRPLPK